MPAASQVLASPSCKWVEVSCIGMCQSWDGRLGSFIPSNHTVVWDSSRATMPQTLLVPPLVRVTFHSSFAVPT